MSEDPRSEHLRRFLLDCFIHDVRAPLTAISGYAEIMLMGIGGAVNDTQRRRLEAIVAAAGQMGTLLDDVCDVAQFDAGLVRLAPQPAALGPMVEAALAALRPLAAEWGVELEACLPPDLPEALLDPRCVRRAVSHLAANALNFTPAGGRVTVAARAEAGRLALTVSDSGAGIPADELEAVFEPFHQVEANKALARRRGLGLGLALCRRIALAHGGALAVESQPGRGSVFTLAFPLARGGKTG